MSSKSPFSPSSRVFVRGLLNCAIVGGLMLAAWPLGQTLYARWNQSQLERQWEQQSETAHGKTAHSATAHSATKNSASGARALKTANEKVLVKGVSNAFDPTMKTVPAPTAPRAKWPLTKLTIPDISLETYAVQGWDETALRRGPGHDPNSALPGAGNCVLAGHRNIYGSYFYQLDQLMPGAPIILENRQGRFVYTTARVFTTTDSDYSIMNQPAPGQTPMLTLITCTMPHTSNRIVVQAALAQS